MLRFEYCTRQFYTPGTCLGIESYVRYTRELLYLFGGMYIACHCTNSRPGNDHIVLCTPRSAWQMDSVKLLDCDSRERAGIGDRTAGGGVAVDGGSEPLRGQFSMGARPGSQSGQRSGSRLGSRLSLGSRLRAAPLGLDPALGSGDVVVALLAFATSLRRRACAGRGTRRLRRRPTTKTTRTAAAGPWWCCPGRFC